MCQGSRDRLCRMARYNTAGGGAHRSRTYLQDRAGAAVRPGVFGAGARKGSLPGQGHRLSPPVRGDLASGTGHLGMAGCIPARAGHPTTLWRLVRNGGVYPRACGAVFSPVLRSAPLRAHPRPCGAALGCARDRVRDPGSSPASGSCPHVVAGAEEPRSIPARAGQPYANSGISLQPRVHPRACGVAFPSRRPWTLGPSLLVRGSHRPAPRRLARPVYPRACGAAHL